MEDEIIKFEDGQLVSNGYVDIEGVRYQVHEAVYSGSTPASAHNVNRMQTNLLEKVKERVGKTTFYSGNLNELKTTGFVISGSSATNAPIAGLWFYIITIALEGNVYQIAKKHTENIKDFKTYERLFTNGTWSEWVETSPKNIQELEVSDLLKNGWTQHEVCQIFKKDKIVHLALCVKNGTGAIIAELPAGFRPKQLMYFPCSSNNPSVTNYVAINAGGNISCQENLFGKLIFINVCYETE